MRSHNTTYTHISNSIHPYECSPITFRLPPRFVQNFLTLSTIFIYRDTHIWTQFRLMKWMHRESMLSLCLIRYGRYWNTVWISTLINQALQQRNWFLFVLIKLSSWTPWTKNEVKNMSRTKNWSFMEIATKDRNNINWSVDHQQLQIGWKQNTFAWILTKRNFFHWRIAVLKCENEPTTYGPTGKHSVDCSF